jgi:hypothetical protein
MKTTKFFLTVLILGCMSFSMTKANPGKDQKSNGNELKNELYSALKVIPYADIMDESPCTINIEFKVSENHEMTDFIITGKNNHLVKYAYWTLSRKTIKVDPKFKPTRYTIDVTFVVKG